MYNKRTGRSGKKISIPSTCMRYIHIMMELMTYLTNYVTITIENESLIYLRESTKC